VLVPNGASDQLVEVSRVPAASVPSLLATGNFDTDVAQDLLWDIGGKRGATFEVEYARVIDGEPLEAITQPQLVSPDTLTIGDVTNDGFDDIAITGTALDGSGRRGLAVIPTRVPAATVQQATDSTCAP